MALLPQLGLLPFRWLGLGPCDRSACLSDALVLARAGAFPLRPHAASLSPAAHTSPYLGSLRARACRGRRRSLNHARRDDQRERGEQLKVP